MKITISYCHYDEYYAIVTKIMTKLGFPVLQDCLLPGCLSRLWAGNLRYIVWIRLPYSNERSLL